MSLSSSSSSNRVVVLPLERDEVATAASIMAHAFCNSPTYRYMLSSSLSTEQQRIQALQWLFQQNIQMMLDKQQQEPKSNTTSSSSTKNFVVMYKICLLEPVSNGDDETTTTTTPPTTTTTAEASNPTTRMIGTFFWTPVAWDEAVDTWTLLRYGMYQLPYRFGSWSSVGRLLRALDDMKQGWKAVTEYCRNRTASTANNNNDKDMWIQLERMTILPEYQGKGYGSLALRQHLQQQQQQSSSSSNNSNTIVRLATQEERNVAFYQKLGFQVVCERECGDVAAAATAAAGSEQNNNNKQRRTYQSWFMVYHPSLQQEQEQQ